LRRPSAAKFALTGCAIAAAGASAYSLLLLVAARRDSVPDPGDEGDPVRSRLVALVPAHDEEATIEPTLRSLAAVDYPHDAWRIIVVADNCTDRTAAVARAHGIEVIERNDRERLGKGFALQHGFAMILAGRDRPDGILVVDADCVVSPTIARAVDRRLRGGAAAVQVGNAVSNPCESTYSALRYAAFTAINGTRPRGRTALGLSAGLLGTGMAFDSDLLERHPWDAFGLAEDAAYHLALVEAGDRVDFAAEAGVESAMPTSFEGAQTQQARWGSGRSELARTWVPRLAAAAFERRELAPLAAAGDLLMPPLSLLVMGTAGLALVSALARARAAAVLAATALVGQTVYVAGSLRLAGAPRCVYRALGSVPILMAWQLRLATENARGRVPSTWVRTDREPEQASS
jgi:hypothetical protein